MRILVLAQRLARSYISILLLAQRLARFTIALETETQNRPLLPLLRGQKQGVEIGHTDFLAFFNLPRRDDHVGMQMFPPLINRVRETAVVEPGQDGIQRLRVVLAVREAVGLEDVEDRLVFRPLNVVGRFFVLLLGGRWLLGRGIHKKILTRTELPITGEPILL